MTEGRVRRLVRERRMLDNRSRIRELVSGVDVVYTDVDATLLGPGGCLLVGPDENYALAAAEAIITALEREIDIVMISGRHARQLHGDARLMGFRNYIAELGCLLVYNLGDRQVLNVGDFPVTHDTVYETIAQSGAPTLLFKHFAGRIEYHKPWSEQRLATHVLRGLIDVEEAQQVLGLAGHHDLKLVDNGAIRKRKGELLPDLPRTHVYHLLPKQAGKPEGVAADRARRSIARDRCIAIGDSEADISIAPEVGAFFLVRSPFRGDGEWLLQIGEQDNIFIADHAMGVGWAEIIHFLLNSD